MKWRERISILSRKRKHVRNVAVAETPSDRISASSSSSSDTGRDDVEKTLSQIRPVIGPDHKSYYILLRGNEDSFMCIQPAKDVITSLDEVVKNVLNSVKQTRPPQGTSLPPYFKTSRNTETRSYKNASKKYADFRKVNGLPHDNNKEIRVTRSVNLDSVEDHKREKFLGTENVVENVVLHRTVQTVNSNHNEVTRTSTLVYPLVQNRLDSSGNIVGTNKQETCSFLPNKKPQNRDMLSTLGSPSVRNFSQNSNSSTNCVYLKTEEPETHVKQETYFPEVQVNEPINNGVGETFMPDNDSLVEKGKSYTEIRLLARDGCVLTEENITEQVKTLIESETLMIEEDSHIVLTRTSAQEVILRISPKEVEEDNALLEHHHFMKEEHLELSDEFLHQEEEEEEEFQSEIDGLTLPDSSLQGDICYSPDMTIADSSNNNSSETDSGVEYLLASVSPSPNMLEECGVKESSLDKVIEEDEEEEASSYCMIDPSVQDPDSIDVEKLLLHSDALMEQNDGIVVIQRSDGALFNQDGTPVSNELQYFITTSLPDDQSLLNDGYPSHVFLSQKP